MAQDRWIDIETAKKLLKNTCKFLEQHNVADFKITDGKEAILMSLYTGAFFILNEKYKFKFRPVADAFHAREPVTLIPSNEEVWSSSEVAPIFAQPLSSYFKFFPDLMKPKYLFMIKGADYTSRKGFFAKERMFKETYEKIKENGLNPADCLIWCSTTDNTYGEDFWEYISSIVLRNKGYFVTCYTLGGGDIYAYYISDYIEKLVKNKLLDKGAFIEELEMLNNVKETTFSLSKMNYESIVIEAESSEMRTRSGSDNAGVGQALRYLSDWNSGYTHAFTAGPFTKIEDVRNKNIGLISCDENGNLIFKEGEAYREPSEEKIEIIKNVIKCSLLRNLSFEERCKLMDISTTNLNEYFDKILILNIDQILEKIKEKLKSS